MLYIGGCTTTIMYGRRAEPWGAAIKFSSATVHRNLITLLTLLSDGILMARRISTRTKGGRGGILGMAGIIYERTGRTGDANGMRDVGVR